MLIAVRHGRTALNQSATRAYADLPLTPLGRGEATNAAEEFRGYTAVDHLHSSDFARSQQSAAPIAAVLGLPVEPAAAFRPWNLGDHDGPPPATQQAAIARLLTTPDHPAPRGESLHTYLDRFVPAVHGMITSPHTHVLVTHGRNIQALLGLAAGRGMDLDPAVFHAENPVKHGGLLVITPDWQATVHNPKIRAVPQLPPKEAATGKSAFEYLTELVGTSPDVTPLETWTTHLADQIPHSLRTVGTAPPRWSLRGSPPPTI